MVSRATNLVARETNLVRHEATPHRGDAQAPAIEFDTDDHPALQRRREVVTRTPTHTPECLRRRPRTTSCKKASRGRSSGIGGGGVRHQRAVTALKASRLDRTIR